MTFKRGAKDAIPIALGYFAVAISFGVATVSYGFPFWSAILTSLTNYTGSGQALGIQLLSVASTSLVELFVAMLAINLRYALMSVTVSQRLEKKVTVSQRFAIAFGMTDENFAAAMMHSEELSFKYMMGLELTAFSGWVGGTVIGSVVGDFLPDVVMTAFKIALPAMFIAIIIPPCRTGKASLFVVGLSTLLSCLFYYVPFMNRLSKGWVYVICGVTSAVIAALLFPIKDEPPDGSAVKQDDGKREGRAAPSADSETATQQDEGLDGSGRVTHGEDTP